MKTTVCFTVLALFLCGCMSSTPPANSSPLTQGNVQLFLKKGVTTKADVLAKFGAPNLTTRDSQGRELWTYQKHATSSRSATAAAGALGPFTTGLAGGGASGSASSETSRTMTLIVKFNASDIVEDFDSRYSSF
jgi:outer membrane protein assembly factor BamE (lipoprotein component of BamABCDE complex)